MTHDEAYVAAVLDAFDSQFHRKLTHSRNGTATLFERADGKPLTKKQVAFLDGVTLGFWTRHHPAASQFNAIAANKLSHQHATLCFNMAAEAKSVGIKRALLRAGNAIVRCAP